MNETSKTAVQFDLLDKPSNSKGWGRYSAWVDGVAIVTSRTGNEWVSASHGGECAEGATIILKCQTMNRKKRGGEETATEEFRLIAAAGETCEIESRPMAQGIRLRVTGARLAE